MRRLLHHLLVAASLVAAAGCGKATAPHAAPPAPPVCKGAVPESAPVHARQAVLRRQAGNVVDVAFSPSGRYLASAARDGSVWIWDVAARAQVRTLRPAGVPVPQQVLWDGETRLVARGRTEDFSGFPKPVAVDPFAPEGVPTAFGEEDIWSLRRIDDGGPARFIGSRRPTDEDAPFVFVRFDEGGAERGTFAGFTSEEVRGMVLSGDARWVFLVGEQHRIGVWPVTGGEAPAFVADVADGEILEVAALHDGSAVVASVRVGPPPERFLDDRRKTELRVISMRAGVAPRTLALPRGTTSIADLAISPDGARLAVLTDAGLFTFQTATWALEARGSGEGSLLRFSPDGRFLAVARDGLLALLDARRPDVEIRMGAPLEEARDAVFVGDDQVAVISPSATTSWSISSAALTRRRRTLLPNAVAPLPSGALVVFRPSPDVCGAGQRSDFADVWPMHEAPPPPRPRTAWGTARGVMPSRIDWSSLLDAPRSGVLCIPTVESTIMDIPGTPDEAFHAFEVLALDTVHGHALVNPRPGYILNASPPAVVDVRTGATHALHHSGVDWRDARLSGDGALAVVLTGSRSDTGIVPGGHLELFDTTTFEQRGTRRLAEEDVTELALAPDDAVGAIARGEAIDVFELAQDGTRSTMQATGRVTALALGAHGRVVAAGTADGELVVFDGAARRGSAPSDGGAIQTLRMSPSEAYAVSTSADGVARVWDLAAVTLRGSLVSFEDEEWAVTTPNGAYVGTAEVEERIGWIFDAPVERYAFAQFAKTFHRPDVVLRRMRGEAIDVDGAVRRPPRVEEVVAPAVADARDKATLRVRFASTSRVDTVRAFVDSKPAGVAPVCAARGEVDLQVDTLPGTNRVTVVAFDDRGAASNEASVDVVDRRADARRPDLYIVAVGVAAYPHLLDHVVMPEARRRDTLESMQLPAARDDALGLARDLAALAGRPGSGRPYAVAHVDVHADDVGSLTPDAIRHSLDGLAAMKPDDVAVVLLAGHGMKPADSADMLFVTGNAELDPGGRTLTRASLAAATVAWSDIARALSLARGRVLVLLDACHSGHMTQDLVVPDDVLANALGGRAGAIVFAAAKGRQVSFEPGTVRELRLDLEPAARARVGGESHGFFTGAFLAALRDPSTDTDGDGALEASEIIDEVARRVEVASRGEQTPWVARRDMFGDFKIADTPK